MRKLVRREGRRKAVVGGRVVKMQKIRGALEQIGGQISRLVVNPSGGEVERNFLARGAHFDGTEAVQNLLDFVRATFRKQQKEIVVAESRGNVRAAAGLFQAAAEFLERGVHRGLTVSHAEMRELIHMNSGDAQRGVLATRSSHFFSEMLLERRSRVQTRHWIECNRFQYLLGNRW